MSAPAFSILDVLNSKEILVAEAIQARAWQALGYDDHIDTELIDAEKSRLDGIVLRLMSNRSRSIGDIATAAVKAFRDGLKVAHPTNLPLGQSAAANFSAQSRSLKRTFQLT